MYLYQIIFSDCYEATSVDLYHKDLLDEDIMEEMYDYVMGNCGMGFGIFDEEKIVEMFKTKFGFVEKEHEAKLYINEHGIVKRGGLG